MSIHQRPDDVKADETFGEWDGDLMVSARAQGEMTVVSLVERRPNDLSSTGFMSKLLDGITLCDRLNGTLGKGLRGRTPAEAFREERMTLRSRTPSQRPWRVH